MDENKLINGRCETVFFYVVIPAFNAEKYIERAIDSILKQDYCHFLLVLIDDGSADCTGDIIDENATLFPSKIIAHHQDNKGIFAARVKAIEIVNKHIKENNITNPYVMMCDTDDCFEKNTLSSCFSIILKEQPDFIYFSFKETFNDKVIAHHRNEITGTHFMDEKLFLRLIYDDQFNNVWQKCVKADLYKLDYDVNAFPKIGMSDDFLLSFSIYIKAKKVVFTNDELYLYEINPQSITHSINIDKYHVSSFCFPRYFAYLRLINECLLNQDLLFQYIENRRNMLLEELWMIIKFKCNNKLKIQVFKEQLNHNYYQSLVKNITLKCFPLKAYKTKHFVLLCLLLFIWKILKKIRIISFKI